DRAAALAVDALAALEVRRAGAAGKALLADPDELLESALKPGRHHDALGMPNRAEVVPPPGVAPHRPVVDEFGNDDAVELGGGDRHVVSPRCHSVRRSRAEQGGIASLRPQ